MPPAILPSYETERLAALRSYQILDTTCEATFDNLAHLAARLTGCPTALVSLVDADRQWFKARHGLDVVETSRDLAFCAHAILDPASPLVVTDALSDSRFADNPLVTGEPGIRFYAGMPVVNADGYALGTVCVLDYVPKEIDPKALEALSDLARAVMPLIEQHKAIRQLTIASHQIENRLVSVIEALPAAVVLAGKAGRIRLVNQEAERMFGYDRAELKGKSLEVLLPKRFRQHHVGLRRGFLTKMSSRALGGDQVLFGLRKGGREFPLEIGLSQIDLDGEQVALAIIVDVSSKHKIELDKQRELERSNVRLQEFVYAAAHDLKAPLRAVGHLAECVRLDIGAIATSEKIENLALLQARVARLQMLLAGLVAYCRVGQADLITEDLAVAEAG